MKIEYLKRVDSTNSYLKQFIQKRENIAVFADVQTDGHGTKGRSFLSDMGGVYFSVLVFYPDMVPANSFRIMAHAAVAVCRTAEQFGIEPEIKWPNDIRAGKKKLAGILIENELDGNRIDHSLIGIGLNVTNDVSALGGIAVSMYELLKIPPTVETVRESLLNNFLTPSTFDEYLSRVRFLGEEIDVCEGEERYTATASRILPDGRLEVVCGGTFRILSSAEITLRPMEER